MTEILCQFNQNCSGYCETDEEVEMDLCCDCLLVAAFNFIADIRAATGDPEGKLMQDEFIEHVKELNHLAYKVKAATGLKDACFAQFAGYEAQIKRLKEKTSMQQAAIEKTISDNLHLADGENCTLIDLKKALRGDFSPWTEINYNDHETFPDENRPCIVAWADHPDHPDRHAMHVFNDVGDYMRLWQNAISDEVHDWDGTLENPTHWMYAPEYRV